MRIPTRARQHGLRFNITPLIDIIFLLIIFFLAASHFVRSEASESVELPEATQVAQEEQIPRRLIITVLTDQSIQVGGNRVDMRQLEQMILAGRLSALEKEFEVRIRADRKIPYRDIEPILLACARANVTNVGFAVFQK